MTARATAFVALGSNLGDRRRVLGSALDHLATLPHTRLEAISATYETAPMGPAEFPFLNAAVQLETAMRPELLLEALLGIERAHGRVRERKWGPRILDLDLLLVLDGPDLVRMVTPALVIPHPGILQRDFVLAPLRDLAPDLRLEGRTFAQWLERIPEADRTIARSHPSPVRPTA